MKRVSGGEWRRPQHCQELGAQARGSGQGLLRFLSGPDSMKQNLAIEIVHTAKLAKK
jgi:hypothetical protein